MRPAVTVKRTLEFLHQTAENPDQLNDALLGKPRMLVNRNLRVLQYRPGPLAAAYILSAQDPLNLPLEQLIRLQVYRRDAQIAFPEDRTWEPIFKAINDSVNDCVNAYLETEVMSCAAAEAKFDLISQHVDERAKEMNLDVITIRGLAVDTYPVKFDFMPKRAPLRIMTELEYQKRVFFKLPLEGAWVDVLTEEENLVGRYHYRVDWPTELGGSKEGDFEITHSATLQFKSE